MNKAYYEQNKKHKIKWDWGEETGRGLIGEMGDNLGKHHRWMGKSQDSTQNPMRSTRAALQRASEKDPGLAQAAVPRGRRVSSSLIKDPPGPSMNFDIHVVFQN